MAMYHDYRSGNLKQTHFLLCLSVGIPGFHTVYATTRIREGRDLLFTWSLRDDYDRCL